MATMTNGTRPIDRARRRKLEELLCQAEESLRNRRQMLRDGLPTVASGVLDLEEQSVDAEEQGLGFSVLEFTSRTVQGIETALQRLQAGQFGRCSECCCKISDARLRALPFAALCLACQERQDRFAGAALNRATTGRRGSTRIGPMDQ